MDPPIIILFFLLAVFSRNSLCYELVHQIKDTVEGDHTQYYTLKQESIVILCLISDIGDADMYVDSASNTKTPSYANHEYSSVSTGLDVITILYDKEKPDNTLSIGIHGHPRHERSSYRLYVLVPSKEDLLEHQIWEVDPDSLRQKLIIDVDPLWMANDPKLHRLLESLSGDSPIAGALNWTVIKEWTVWFLWNFLHFVVEVLA